MKKRILIISGVLIAIIAFVSICLLLNNHKKEKPNDSSDKIQETLKDFEILNDNEECLEILDEIYRDDEYYYFLNCMVSDTLYLKYSDGTKILVIDALKEGMVTIDELMEKGLEVQKATIDGLEFVDEGNDKPDDTKSPDNPNSSSGSNTNPKNEPEPKPKKTFSVTFDSSGGSNVSKQTVSENGYAPKPANPSKNGYVFSGWTLNGGPYNFNTPVTSNILLVATWVLDTTPDWPGQYPTFSSESDCKTESYNHTTNYVAQCDQVFNKGGISLGFQLTLTKKSSNPLEQYIWQPNGNWIEIKNK